MPTVQKPLEERSANAAPVNASTEGTKQKRKSDGIENAIDPNDVDLPSDFECVSFQSPSFAVPNLVSPVSPCTLFTSNNFDLQEWSANQVRSKIRQFINSGEMKVGEFQNKFGIGSGSYSRFMSQNGPDKGMQSDTFWITAEFFKRRELAGLKMPRATKKRKISSTSGGESAGPSKKEELKAQKDANDVSDIHLDGEDTDSVPIYDTCDDVRTKINRFLRETPGASNASFIRLIDATLSSSSNKPTARQLPTFLGKKGATAGADSAIFYASYVFFEKLRVKRNKPKSKKRQEMEERWKDKAGKKDEGMSLHDMTRRTIYTLEPSRPYIDRYGEVKGVPGDKWLAPGK